MTDREAEVIKKLRVSFARVVLSYASRRDWVRRNVNTAVLEFFGADDQVVRSVVLPVGEVGHVIENSTMSCREERDDEDFVPCDYYMAKLDEAAGYS